ncbi:hypothetical protein [Neobacillus citreus]|uniref:Uncharacterized protein n=1 Tax=Neobacillus citreus TaxID=2833578 RepID=A0A942T6I5_9BACI|nr:hypothetical protein [Neobacillus citreus]MCH6265339.1 hypothetical protein [Neobacillus citreus]
MGNRRGINVEIWDHPIFKKMSVEERTFYLYLLTNRHATGIGIYHIVRKLIAFELGVSIDSSQALLDRFSLEYELIRYNRETREVAIKDWGKFVQLNGGKRVMLSELKEVGDHSLIPFVSESIAKPKIRSLYDSFCTQEQGIT